MLVKKEPKKKKQPKKAKLRWASRWVQRPCEKDAKAKVAKQLQNFLRHSATLESKSIKMPATSHTHSHTHTLEKYKNTKEICEQNGKIKKPSKKISAYFRELSDLATVAKAPSPIPALTVGVALSGALYALRSVALSHWNFYWFSGAFLSLSGIFSDFGLQQYSLKL